MYKGERKRMMRREELRTIFRERSWKKGEKEKKEEQKQMGKVEESLKEKM